MYSFENTDGLDHPWFFSPLNSPTYVILVYTFIIFPLDDGLRLVPSHPPGHLAFHLVLPSSVFYMVPEWSFQRIKDYLYLSIDSYFYLSIIAIYLCLYAERIKDYLISIIYRYELLHIYRSMLKSSIYYKKLLITWVSLSFLSINHLSCLRTHTSHQPDLYTCGFSGTLYVSLRLFLLWFGLDIIPFLFYLTEL